MSPPVPTDPDDPRHVAHLFGDSVAGAIPELGEIDAEKPWEALDSTAVEDWQMLFARTYGAHRGTA